MFPGGANQKAELRAPTFRGLMRYWERALLAEQRDLPVLREAEAAVFGDTKQGSAVTVKVARLSGDAQTKRTPEWSTSGTRYLFWSMSIKQPNRSYFPPDSTRFQVTLSMHGKQPTSSPLSQAVAAFWLLTQLGGVGSRSRRCAGSLSVEKVELNPTNLIFTPSNDVSSLKRTLESGIKEARKLAAQDSKEARYPLTEQAPYDCLEQENCKIWILQQKADSTPWLSAADAAHSIGEHLKTIRSQIPLPQRKVLGLPLPLSPFDQQRLASPLLLRVTELQNRRYVGIAVLFLTQNRYQIQMQDYQHIINLVQNFHATEVRL
jgi:CRISPR-associated protein Cmr1